MELSAYKNKRDFSKTPEPQGSNGHASDLLRFTVQYHIARSRHYDLRLEWNGVFLSWAVPKGPSYNVKDKRLAVQVEAHPLEYKDFEGVIPKGEYGGGVVMLFDEGFWEPHNDTAKGLDEGMLKFTLHGRRLKGKWALIRLKQSNRADKANWLLIKENDEHVKPTDGKSGFLSSIRTGRTIKEIEEGGAVKYIQNPFNSADVQLAKLASSAPLGEEWVYELKFDGYRVLAFIEAGAVRLVSRNSKDYTERFKKIAASLLAHANTRAMVLDGEMIVITPDGKSDFQALQNYKERPEHLVYAVFDLLALDGEDLRAQPLYKRKAQLEELLYGAPRNIHFSLHLAADGNKSLFAACEAGMEGIIGKRLNSLYSGTRNGDWVKLKCLKEQEFVIGGYARSEKRQNGLSSILLGVYENGSLKYAGRAGTGFKETEMVRLLTEFEPHKSAHPHFLNPPKPRKDEEFTWLAPMLAAKVQFAQWTNEGLLRHASYKGLRTDKAPIDIIREQAEEPFKMRADGGEENPMKSDALSIEGIRITSPNKVVFEEPLVTKEEVVRYYLQISQRMLPYIKNRLLSIVRCPKGISQACFYKKHPGQGGKGIVTLAVNNAQEEEQEYFYIKNLEGLIYEAQMGTIEFHIWASSVLSLESPDIMVFDLDPDEGMELSQIHKGVLDLKGLLDELGLNSYLKTSGGKGYHVVVPVLSSASWDGFSGFAKRIAVVMEQKWPEFYTSNMRKVKRKDKIFIDWARNGRGATSIAPYSIRARKGAAVSMPIAWKELEKIAPNEITLNEALLRLAKPDPWQGFWESGSRLR
ncbi:MAG: putative DNA ligase-like protein [Firmicutes bacterium ADurb.Bin356]|nr:MAG: putative DNA ligase-like protein [Firmicutes bacterium ADurb.Bin356]